MSAERKQSGLLRRPPPMRRGGGWAAPPIMPPTVPWHVVLFGMLFAVVITKMLFGGFGRNIFNPALAGRCFVYICFPVALTGIWYPPAEGPMGALKQWGSV